jgi:3-hydroxy acid dehydrogenase/malonic semialdehyde reductase
MHNTPALQDEIIFITGATSGFGEACARRLAAGGAKLILTGRRKERLIALQQELGHDQTHIAVMDVTDKEAIAAVLSNLPEAFQNITVLINNAGLALGLEPAHLCSLDDWEQMVDTNIKGVMFCTRLIVPAMVQRNRGYILNIGSTAGFCPYPGANVYGASKAFVHQFSQNLRSDLLGSAIRVTVIQPGMVKTDFSSVRFKGDQAKADAVYENTNPITAEDIADTVHWCISRPAHLNINNIEMMPVCQTHGPLSVYRTISNDSSDCIK